MRLLVQVADGRKNPLCCLDFHGGTALEAFKSAALRAVLPPLSKLASPSADLDFYISHNGRIVGSGNPSSRSLLELGFRESDTVLLVPALRGGGGDGGSTCAESRSCYLEMYARKKVEKFDPKDAIFARWTSCLLSAEPLSPPCVVDKLGNLLNKEAVLKALQSKSIPGGLRHIRGLRDVMDVKLTEIPSVAEGALVKFQCPISGLELNGNFRFFAMRCCGNTLSQRALKELKVQSSCPMCHATISQGDALPINGTEEEVVELRKRMDEERAKAKAVKADKKKAAAGAAAGSAGDSMVAAGSSHKVTSASGSEGGKEAGVAKDVADGGNGGVVKKVGGFLRARAGVSIEASSEGPGDVKANADKGPKRREQNQGGQQKRFKAGEHLPAGATKEVYASIFTSSRKEEFKETYSCRSLPLGRN